MSDVVRRVCDKIWHWLGPDSPLGMFSGMAVGLLCILATMIVAPPVLYVFRAWVRWWLP